MLNLYVAYGDEFTVPGADGRRPCRGGQQIFAGLSGHDCWIMGWPVCSASGSSMESNDDRMAGRSGGL